MGLDVSHDCWHGAYSRFNRYRRWLAQAAGMPPLDMMDGFYQGLLDPCWKKGLTECGAAQIARHEIGLPISWKALKPDIVHELLNHSDCDGEIDHSVCSALADRLQEILDSGPQEDETGFVECTEDWIVGLQDAANAGENVEFG